MTASQRPATVPACVGRGVFRAIWPVIDDTRTYGALCREAALEVPMLAAQAKAKLLDSGRFSVAPSEAVPGSGGITDTVLIYEAPALPRDPSKCATLSLHFREVAS